jgi:hypothetical protein
MRVRVLSSLVLALALTSSACGSDEPAQAASPTPSPAAAASASPTHVQHSPAASPSPAQAPPSSPQGRAFLSLCEVRSAVAAGDAESAEATFEDDAHDTLHEIAHELEEVDRRAAAALLVAKSKVEAGFAEPEPDVEELERDVAALLEATSDGMAALDLDVPGCPTR